MDNSAKQKEEQAYRQAADFDIRYGGCSQAVYSALQPAFNIGNDDIFRALGGLAGGGASRGDGSCGAYCGAVIFMGHFAGRDYADLDKNSLDLKAYQKRDELYRLVDQLHEKFISSYGSIICRNIQIKLYGRPFFLRDDDERKKFRESGGHTLQGCPGVCGNAARWTAEILHEFLNG